MAQTKARDAQRRRATKPKSPVRVQKGKKQKPKLPDPLAKAGIPVGLAALVEQLKKKRKKREALKQLLEAPKKRREALKRILSTPKKKP